MSVAAAPPAASAAPETPPSPPRSRALILIVAGVIVLGALGGGAWFLVPKFFGSPKPAAAAVKEPVKATVALGSVVVNLNGEVRRYLRVGVSLGVPSAKDVKEVEEYRSQLLDIVISVFSAADVDTLTSEDGKTEIKEELLERMHEALKLEKVASVYFTEFVIQ